MVFSICVVEKSVGACFVYDVRYRIAFHLKMAVYKCEYAELMTALDTVRTIYSEICIAGVLGIYSHGQR